MFILLTNLSAFFFKYTIFLESEAESQINLKTSQMENENLKSKIKSLEETLGRFREEISKTFNSFS